MGRCQELSSDRPTPLNHWRQYTLLAGLWVQRRWYSWCDKWGEIEYTNVLWNSGQPLPPKYSSLQKIRWQYKKPDLCVCYSLYTLAFMYWYLGVIRIKWSYASYQKQLGDTGHGLVMEDRTTEIIYGSLIHNVHDMSCIIVDGFGSDGGHRKNQSKVQVVYVSSWPPQRQSDIWSDKPH